MEQKAGMEEFDGRGRSGRGGNPDRDKSREVGSGLVRASRLGR